MGVPAVIDSQNLFGVDRRWFSELAGTATMETSADAVQLGHVVRMDGRQRDVPPREAGIGIALTERVGPWPEPEHHERCVVEPEDRLSGLVEATLPTDPPEEEDDRPLRRQAGRLPDAVGPGGRRRPARLAVHQDGRFRVEAPGPPEMGGDRLVDRHDRVGRAGPTALPASVEGKDGRLVRA